MRNFKRILSFIITFALVFGLFPPVDLHIGHDHGIHIDTDNLSGLTVPVNAAASSGDWVDGASFFDGTLALTYKYTNNDGTSVFTVVTADSAVKATARNPRSFSNTTATVTLRMTNNCEKKATLAFKYNFTV